MALTPEMTSYLIYAAIAFGGMLVKHYFPNIIPFLPATPGAASSSAPLSVPTVPGKLTIGHGELLSLLVAALKTDPASVPALTPPVTPAPAEPAKPA